MRWVKRAFRVWGVAGLVLLLPGLLPISARAEWAQGYCTEDGTAVVTYWPPGMEEDHRAFCHDGRKFVVTLKYPPVDDPTRSNEPVQWPDDFGRIVGLILNRSLMVNPYDDVFPYVVKSTGRILIPLRYVSEGIGAKVTWDADVRRATVQWKDRVVEVVIGERTARVNGQEVTLDQAPIIWLNRTMVPLRFLMEAFGAQIVWYDSASKVAITLPEANCPPAYCVH